MTPAVPTVRHRWLFVLAVIVGAAYWLVGRAVIDHGANIAFKGLCVSLLALWAALNARGREGWLIAAVLALGALGDVLIEFSLSAGAIAFLAGHLVAIALYLLHRRSRPGAAQVGLAAARLIVIPVIAFMLPADRAAAPGITLYAIGLGAMAAAAAISLFPRQLVSIGALLFVISDLLIFARMGPLFDSPLPPLLVWPLYVAGQAMIAWGVVTTLARWRASEELHHRL